MNQSWQMSRTTANDHGADIPENCQQLPTTMEQAFPLNHFGHIARARVYTRVPGCRIIRARACVYLVILYTLK